MGQQGWAKRYHGRLEAGSSVGTSSHPCCDQCHFRPSPCIHFCYVYLYVCGGAEVSVQTCDVCVCWVWMAGLSSKLSC